MIDFHVHSRLSFDGSDSIDSFCQRALQRGIVELCFCEHVELGNLYPPNWDGCLDFTMYTQEIQSAQKKYPQLCIRMGVEAGLVRGYTTKMQDYLAQQPLDFVLASQHTAGGKDPFMDKDYFDHQTVTEATTEFLMETYCNLIQFKDYDAVGHLPYISLRTSPPAPVHHADYADPLDAILQEVASTGKGLEINTVSLFMYDQVMPSLCILKRFRELGGEIITIGSDAHYLVTLGHGFDAAIQLAHATGFRYLCTFENRQALFHPLP